MSSTWCVGRCKRNACFCFGRAWRDRALRPKFADAWLPKNWDPVLIRVQEGIMSLFCLCFAIIASQVVIETFHDDVQSVVLRIVIWPFQAVIPLAFFMTSIRHFLYTIDPKNRPTVESSDELEGEQR